MGGPRPAPLFDHSSRSAVRHHQNSIPCEQNSEYGYVTSYIWCPKAYPVLLVSVERARGHRGYTPIARLLRTFWPAVVMDRFRPFSATIHCSQRVWTPANCGEVLSPLQRSKQTGSCPGDKRVGSHVCRDRMPFHVQSRVYRRESEQ
jgi:hypothetical protein